MARRLVGPGARSALVISLSVVSISAVMGQPYNAPYCASKAALLLGMRSLAVELGTKGVRVNCVSPGQVHTPMLMTGLSPEVYENMKKQTPLGYVAEPEMIHRDNLILS